MAVSARYFFARFIKLNFSSINRRMLRHYHTTFSQLSNSLPILNFVCFVYNIDALTPTMRLSQRLTRLSSLGVVVVKVSVKLSTKKINKNKNTARLKKAYLQQLVAWKKLEHLINNQQARHVWYSNYKRHTCSKGLSYTSNIRHYQHLCTSICLNRFTKRHVICGNSKVQLCCQVIHTSF